MEGRSRLVRFGVGIVVLALFYLLYHAAGRLFAPGPDRAERPAPAHDGREAPPT
jgi:hypothetical protein